jgi:hypothetical protein
MPTLNPLPQHSRITSVIKFPSIPSPYESFSPPHTALALQPQYSLRTAASKRPKFSVRSPSSPGISKPFEFNSLHGIVLPNPCRIINIQKPWCISITSRCSKSSISINSIKSIIYKIDPFSQARSQAASCPYFGSGSVHFLLESESDLAYNRPRIESTVAGKGSFRINKFSARGSVSFWALLHLSS